MKFKGKVAVVTGGGAGIGRAIVLALAKEGAALAVADIDFSAAKKVAAEIRSLGGKALPLKVDVSKSKDIDQMVNRTLEKLKQIDILVNNAGIYKGAAADQLAEADWDAIIRVNLKGTFLCSQVVGRLMIQNKRGKIVNIASIGAHRALLGTAAYAASKAGILQLTRVLAVDWAKYNINVNSVSPGQTLTTMAKRGEKQTKGLVAWEERERIIPLKRANKPEDIANAVLFLASSESDNITGQDIKVDGGISALHPTSVLGLQRQAP